MNKKWIPVLLTVAMSSANAHESMTFGIVGDYGDNSDREKQVSELVDKHDPEFIITMGDNNYPDGCWDTIDKNIGKYYSKYIGNYKGDFGHGAAENRFFPSLGNHDWNAVPAKCLYKGDIPYLSYFTLPNNGRYYDFKKGSVHFFAIDSDVREPDGNKIDSKQYEWLKQGLKQSDSCFNVVYFHHAAYSSGEHGPNKAMQWGFEKLGADIVLSGHDHHYERIEHNGLTYIVNGLGGAEFREPTELIEGSKVVYGKTNGYMLATVDGGKMTFVFRDLNDDVKDQFVVKKDCK